MEQKLPTEPIKMVAIDIDGTLLTPEKTLTHRTIAAVSAAQEAGVAVTLATARRFTGTRVLSAELNIQAPLVLYDGGELFDRVKQEIIDAQVLSAKIAQQAAELLVRHDIQPIVHPLTGAREEIWMGPEELDSVWTAAYMQTMPEQLHRHHVDTLCVDQPDPLRVVGFAELERIQQVQPLADRLHCTTILTPRGNFGCAEISFMPLHCSKASGVQLLADRLQIPMTAVMALGDNYNDIPMLQAAGWGVAMGQAYDAVKAAANTLTATNREDGVALAIERYVLGEGYTYTPTDEGRQREVFHAY